MLEMGGKLHGIKEMGWWFVEPFVGLGRTNPYIGSLEARV
jgi:hypothetical protein